MSEQYREIFERAGDAELWEAWRKLEETDPQTAEAIQTQLSKEAYADSDDSRTFHERIVAAMRHAGVVLSVQDMQASVRESLDELPDAAASHDH